MDYQKVIEILKQKGKIKIARFIEMYYIENKTQEEISKELRIETVRGYYSFRRRCKTIVHNILIDNKVPTIKDKFSE